MPLLQLMVLVKYLGVTATATGTDFAHVFLAVAVAALPFSSHLTATKTNLVTPVPVAVATRQFGRKITKPFLIIRKKKLIFAKNGKIFFFLKNAKIGEKLIYRVFT